MRCSCTAYGLLAATTLAITPAAVAAPVDGARSGSFTYDLFRKDDQDNANSRRGSPSIKELVSARGSRGDWYINATIGGQPVDLMVDTGSATLWTLGPKTASSNPSASVYDPSKSATTNKKQGYSFTTTYFKGDAVQGDVYNDNVCLGDQNDCVDMISFGVATTAVGVGDFRSGVVGLAFNDSNGVLPRQQPTFMDYLVPHLAEPIFALKLGSSTQQGQITFGSVDTNSYTGSLQQIQVQTNFSKTFPGQWIHPNATFSKNGKSLGSFPVSFDTGTVETMAPNAVVQAYFSGVQGAQKTSDPSGMWSVGCNTQLPDLTLTMDAATMVIPGSKLIFGATSNPSMCYVSLIASGNSTIGFVGAAFFEQHVAIFNQGNRTISWGKQV